MSRIVLTNGQYADLIIAADDNTGGIVPLPNGTYADTVLPVDINGNPIVIPSRQAIGGVGRWYIFSPQIIVSATALALGINTILFMPILIERTLSINSLGLNVTTGAAGSLPRLGIYNSNSNFEPSTLLIDAGTIDASTAGGKNTNNFNITLTPNLYWEACLCNIACTVSAFNTSSSLSGAYTLGSNSIGINTVAGRSVAQTYGNLPATVTGTTITGGTVPIIYTRTN